MAGAEALTGPQDEAEAMVAEFKVRRDMLVDGLNAIEGVSCKLPKGAFYVFANAKHVSMDSYRLAFDILEKACVGVTPGIDFGQNGEGYLRFSYANSMENIAEGMNRLSAYLETRT